MRSNLTRSFARRRFRWPACSAVLLLALACPPKQSSAQQDPAQTHPMANASSRYELVELPLRPNWIADSGWIAGMAPDQRAALVNPHGELIHIPLPPEFTLSEALCVNAKGEAVGYAVTADSSRRVAFLFRDAKVTILPGEQARAYRINEAGEIAGQAKTPGQKTVAAVLWKNGNLVDLKICCAGTARVINAQSLVAGDAYDDEGHYHAFFWDAQHGARRVTFPAMGGAGEEYSLVLALNDRGQAVLRVAPGGLLSFSEGKFEPLDLPQADPRAMNQAGVIVGSVGPSPELQKAFVWDKVHGMIDLNDAIPAKSGWELDVASSLNDHGEIVGWGEHAKSENAGFLLRLK